MSLARGLDTVSMQIQYYFKILETEKRVCLKKKDTIYNNVKKHETKE